jgi:serine/threonine protein kinase/formylglycine-generating enzyme required for sulfatase activity
MAPQDPDRPDTPSPNEETESAPSTVEFEAVFHDEPRDGQPQQIGSYKILGLLGEGGMGIVYLAEQREPIRRRVALKCMTRADHKEFLARFEAERQALALMNHSNIARVYEAGVTDGGLPYFAMEHVQGVPIAEYCDQHRLSIGDRLKLFVQICQGIEHAHHRGVIHRDIKPSNILVSAPDEEPVAKIIDFGVAKATNQRLTERTLYTEVGRVIGTPQYMSPEQAKTTGEDVDHRTDIYSLGVLLYELLVGQLPLELDLRSLAIDEVVRRIREEEPATPSTRWMRLNPERTTKLATERRVNSLSVLHELRGDLDWICMKAIEKERTSRYSTAAQFAEDIQRYLRGEPAEAGPPSAFYRLRKFVRRHRVPVVLVCTVELILAIALIAVIWFALELRESEQRAREAERDVAVAHDRLTEYLALADLQLLEEYTAEARDLLPSSWEKVENIKEYLARAAELIARRELHQSELRKLRRRTGPDSERQRNDQRRAMIATLLKGLSAFSDPDPEKGTFARIQKRLEWILPAEVVSARWKELVAWGAMDEPLADLIPLGRDPDSQLWEFARAGTGRVPERGSDGKLSITEDPAIVLVLLPGGEFPMGWSVSPDAPAAPSNLTAGDGNGRKYELGNSSRRSESDNEPIHQVTLSPFLISKFEITQRQWEIVMGDNPSRFKGKNLPVESVSWLASRDFCRKLGLSLPSEAQWEYGCRAGTTGPYGGTGDPDEMGWNAENSESIQPVGERQPNAFDLYDMHGNVCEWCRDRYDRKFYSKPEAVGPDPVCHVGSFYPANYVIRGGSFLDRASSTGSACRRSLSADRRSRECGFRPVRLLQDQ